MLVGPSGCGKTTAMRMVNRMIDITEGDILLDGQSVRERRPAELRRDIGYAIQQVGLFPHLSVADNIATVPRLLDWDRERIRARVDQLLELVSLDPARDARPLPGPALRRAAPAGGRGAGARGGPAADADGRALRRDRPDQPRAPSERVPAPPARDPQDGRLRDPRHRRGDQDGRPHRGAPEGRQARPVRAARRAADATGEPVRRGLRGLRQGAQAAGPPAGARRGPVGGAARAGGRVRRPRRAARSPARRCPTRCWWTTRGGRSDGSPSAPCRASGSATSCARGPTPCSRWTTCCATRSPACSRRRRSTGRSWTSDGAVTGVLSIEILSHALKEDPEKVPSGADAL